jgi:hypothetical protein
MQRIGDLTDEAVVRLIHRYGLDLEILRAGEAITGSYWGEPEAGIVGDTIYVRGDTPVHSLLHEASHLICMSPDRRARLDGDAGGGDLEECAVCFLQILLANELPDVGGKQLMRDMDDWGYSFRLGSATRWFERDASDARGWLVGHGLVDGDGKPTFQRRRS